MEKNVSRRKPTRENSRKKNFPPVKTDLPDRVGGRSGSRDRGGGCPFRSGVPKRKGGKSRHTEAKGGQSIAKMLRQAMMIRAKIPKKLEKKMKVKKRCVREGDSAAEKGAIQKI